MRARVRLALAPLALAALALGSCSKGQSGTTPPGGQVCTQIGCLDGLRVELTHPGAWPAGDYTFTLVADGAAITCVGALPLPPCEAGRALTCDRDGAQIVESGCALPADAHGFAEILLPGPPVAELALTIARGGEPLVATTLRPTYRESRPNGPGCEPLCRSADLAVAVP